MALTTASSVPSPPSATQTPFQLHPGKTCSAAFPRSPAVCFEESVPLKESDANKNLGFRSMAIPPTSPFIPAIHSYYSNMLFDPFLFQPPQSGLNAVFCHILPLA